MLVFLLPFRAAKPLFLLRREPAPCEWHHVVTRAIYCRMRSKGVL